ncbi:basic proline-rich protein-like [Osmerus eperlanus]|uniref:basic proline-rich protein-like n=1 Tax=Osmerus eperlanus TaxID=29151 RepID=UPI002E15B62F
MLLSFRRLCVYAAVAVALPVCPPARLPARPSARPPVCPPVWPPASCCSRLLLPLRLSCSPRLPAQAVHFPASSSAVGMDLLVLRPSHDEFPSRLERRSRPWRSGRVLGAPGRSLSGAAPGSSAPWALCCLPAPHLPLRATAPPSTGRVPLTLSCAFSPEGGSTPDFPPSGPCLPLPSRWPRRLPLFAPWPPLLPGLPPCLPPSGPLPAGQFRSGLHARSGCCPSHRRPARSCLRHLLLPLLLSGAGPRLAGSCLFHTRPPFPCLPPSLPRLLSSPAFLPCSWRASPPWALHRPSALRMALPLLGLALPLLGLALPSPGCAPPSVGVLPDPVSASPPPPALPLYCCRALSRTLRVPTPCLARLLLPRLWLLPSLTFLAFSQRLSPPWCPPAPSLPCPCVLSPAPACSGPRPPDRVLQVAPLRMTPPPWLLPFPSGPCPLLTPPSCWLRRLPLPAPASWPSTVSLPPGRCPPGWPRSGHPARPAGAFPVGALSPLLSLCPRHLPLPPLWPPLPPGLPPRVCLPPGGRPPGDYVDLAVLLLPSRVAAPRTVVVALSSSVVGFRCPPCPRSPSRPVLAPAGPDPGGP